MHRDAHRTAARRNRRSSSSSARSSTSASASVSRRAGARRRREGGEDVAAIEGSAEAPRSGMTVTVAGMAVLGSVGFLRLEARDPVRHRYSTEKSQRRVTAGEHRGEHDLASTAPLAHLGASAGLAQPRGIGMARRDRRDPEWAVPGSNQRPPACKAGALPAELTARVLQCRALSGGSGMRKGAREPRWALGTASE